MSEILHPADGTILPDNAVFHIVQIKAVLLDLLPDAGLHVLYVPRVNHAQERSSGEVLKLLFRLTAEHLEDGPVGVEHLTVVVPIDKKSPGHLIGKPFNLPGGEALPV